MTNETNIPCGGGASARGDSSGCGVACSGHAPDGHEEVTSRSSSCCVKGSEEAGGVAGAEATGCDPVALDAELSALGKAARKAARRLGVLSGAVRNGALAAMAEALRRNTADICAANARDLAHGRSRGLSAPLLERLALTSARVESMARGLEDIAALRDPLGEVTGMWTTREGLRIGRLRVPLGVVGIIYESRPNVTADAAGLCIKSGNAVLLRGGREALATNTLLADLLARAAEAAGVPEGSVQMVASPHREATTRLMSLDALDVLIPRGGKSLKAAVRAFATVPILMTGMGNCHIYVDAGADIDRAVAVADNAKTSRPAVCNAAETLLVHADIAPDFLPRCLAVLAAKGVEIRGDARTRALFPAALPASEADWDTEYLDLILAVRVVDSLDEALDHIARHGTGHSEAICTESYGAAERFLREVDAAAVYVNASTRFTDGGVYGFGAEMGISTQKLHARGPLGVEQLTSTKFIAYGTGQIRTS